MLDGSMVHCTFCGACLQSSPLFEHIMFLKWMNSDHCAQNAANHKHQTTHNILNVMCTALRHDDCSHARISPHSLVKAKSDKSQWRWSVKCICCFVRNVFQLNRLFAEKSVLSKFLNYKSLQQCGCQIFEILLWVMCVGGENKPVCFSSAKLFLQLRKINLFFQLKHMLRLHSDQLGFIFSEFKYLLL